MGTPLSGPVLVRARVADAISDRLVDFINRELAVMRAQGEVTPASLLAGLLLGVMALAHSAPQPHPQSLQEVERAVRACLEELLAMSDLA